VPSPLHGPKSLASTSSSGFTPHYLASMLIEEGSDVKVVQARLRHSSAKTTLDTYGHLWPDSDDSTRAAIDTRMTARADYLRTSGTSGL